MVAYIYYQSSWWFYAVGCLLASRTRSKLFVAWGVSMSLSGLLVPSARRTIVYWWCHTVRPAVIQRVFPCRGGQWFTTWNSLRVGRHLCITACKKYAPRPLNTDWHPLTTTIQTKGPPPHRHTRRPWHYGLNAFLPCKTRVMILTAWPYWTDFNAEMSHTHGLHHRQIADR